MLIHYFKIIKKRIVDFKKVFFLCHSGNLKSKSYKISPDAKYGVKVRLGSGVITDKKVSIGDYTYINRTTCVENCNIGKYCSISEGVRINRKRIFLSL